MAEPDDSELLPTQPCLDTDGFAPLPSPPLSDSVVDALFGARSSRPSAGWQPPPPEELHARLPQYEIRALLGRGGMGAVYKGWQRSLERLVAIKILRPGLEAGDTNFAARFKREAKAMAQLKHPGIVPVHDAGETADGLLYFVMDFVQGVDLQKLIAAQGRLPAEQATTITAQVVDALAYAHRHGIIHRDIKPANILIDDEDRVHVADFGIARTAESQASVLTGSHVVMGTPDFMAPESLLGADQVDQRADLYAVGVMLYQMLTGKLPRGRFEAPSRVAPGLDKRLDRIVDRALQTERNARYSSAVEFRADLEAVLTGARTRRAQRSARLSSWPGTLWIGLAAAILGLAGTALYLGKAKPPRVIAAAPVVSNAAPVISKASPVPLTDTGAIKIRETPDKVPATPGIRWENPGSTSATGQDPIAGQWLWADGVTVDLSENGHAFLRTLAFNMEGKWTFTSINDGERSYVVMWQNGLWIDKMTLSSNNRHLFGQNQYNVKLNASRVSSFPATDSSPKPVAVDQAAKEGSRDQHVSHALPPGVKVVGVEVVNQPAGTSYGDIQVQLSDDRKEVWTTQGLSSDPKVSGKGDVGWVDGSKFSASGRRTDKDTLIVQSAKGKHRALSPNANGPFVEEWAFIDHDSAVVIKSRGNHGAASFIKYDLATGRVLDHVDGYVSAEQMPPWARPYADQ